MTREIDWEKQSGAGRKGLLTTYNNTSQDPIVFSVFSVQAKESKSALMNLVYTDKKDNLQMHYQRAHLFGDGPEKGALR